MGYGRPKPNAVLETSDEPTEAKQWNGWRQEIESLVRRGFGGGSPK
jgi:hypothetical protein